MVGEFFVGVEYNGDEKGDDEEVKELGAEVIRILTVEVAVVEAPEEGGGEGDFDVFPGGFIDGGEEAEDVLLLTDVVEEVRQNANGRDDDDAEPEIEGVIHRYIITLMVYFGGIVW